MTDSETGPQAAPETDAENDFEPWLVQWCRRELESPPAEPLLAVSQTSDVVGVRLDDGRAVIVKSRPDPTRRAVTCVAVQRHAAGAGFPCARPLTDATYVGGRAVHAEEWRPGGEVLRGDGPEAAELFGRLFAELMSVVNDLRPAGAASRLHVAPPLPNPEWVRWDHDEAGVWPANPVHDARPGASSLPADLVEAAVRVRSRLAKAEALPRVLGHADWESQNLRWDGTMPHSVHDWDSLAWQPEAALVGAACGAFASWGQPTLAPITSSEAFITAYEDTRDRRFSDEEREVMWAASLWTPLHNARGELLWDWPQTSLGEIRTQGAERLRRGGA